MSQRFLCFTMALSFIGKAFSAQLLRTGDPVLREEVGDAEESSAPIGTVRVAVDATGSAAAAPRSFAESTHHTCKEGMFACDGNRCMSRLNVCDGALDCYDGSDENFCLGHVQASMGRRGRLVSHEAEEAEPSYRKLVEERETQQNLAELKAKLPAYLTVRVPGYIPPPKDQYKDFLDNYNLDVVDKLPRLDEDKDYDVIVYHLAQPISDKLLSDAGVQHSGIGFRILRPDADGKGGKSEAFRMDVQYWACIFSESFGPHYSAEDNLMLNDKNQMEFRQRAVVTGSKTHGKWHNDWNHGVHLKLGHITAKDFNRGMAFSEHWAKNNKYFQVFSYMKGGHEVIPAKNCVAFAVALSKEILGMNLWEHKGITLTRTGYHLHSFETVNILKEPDKVNEPHTDKVIGYATLLEPQFEQHIRDRLLNYYMLRNFYRWQSGKTWTIPLWYGEDGKEYEVSDHPVYFGSVVVDSFEVQRSGENPQKKQIGRLHLPKLVDAPTGHMFADAPTGHMFAEAEVRHLPKTLKGDAGKAAKKIEEVAMNHASAVDTIQQAITHEASEVISEIKHKKEKLKNDLHATPGSPASEAVRMIEIGGEMAEKLNKNLAEGSFVEGVKILEEALTEPKHKENFHQKPAQNSKPPPRKVGFGLR